MPSRGKKEEPQRPCIGCPKNGALSGKKEQRVTCCASGTYITIDAPKPGSGCVHKDKQIEPRFNYESNPWKIAI